MEPPYYIITDKGLWNAFPLTTVEQVAEGKGEIQEAPDDRGI